MARQIVTQQAVNDVADALHEEGADPSIMAVQSRIGGGSFSTVKRCLDVWRQAKTEAANTAPDTPPEVQAKGQEFARAVWALASREAQREAQHLKDAATDEVAAVRAELADATTEIARLEGVESENAATIEQQQTKLRAIEIELAAAQADARRVQELEHALTESRAALEAARQAATDKAVEGGRLAGEAEALRAQVRELMAALQAKAK